MKKQVLGAVVAAMMLGFVGCGAPKGEGNPIAEWQADRFNAEVITAANTAARPLTIEDVTYVSTLEQPALAAPINTFAIVPAALYLKVVTEVDQMAVEQDGRLIYIGVQNDLAAGEKWEDLKAMMTPEDLAAYTAYQKKIAQIDQGSIIDDIVLPMIAKLTEESAKVALLVDGVRNDPAFAALTGFELIKTGKKLAADGANLSAQFADTIKGANLWLELLKKDREAKAFMQDYPVE